MPSKTDFNVSPYYDDFAESKKFHRVMYRPAYAVQARELTTQQSITQNQIERMSDSVFRHGAMVIPGEANYDLNYYAVKLTSFNGTLANYDSTTLTGGTSGVVADVIGYVATDGTDPDTLFVKYRNSGTDNASDNFTDGETLTSGHTDAMTAVCSTTATGSRVTIDSGVYYINGFFVNVDTQQLTLDKYTNTPSYRVGLTITETFVTSTDDTSLLDNATGSSNANATGAHRFKIDLTLAKLSLTSTADASFVELFRLKSGKLQDRPISDIKTSIEDTLARRTFDESGDYSVRDFELDVRESLLSGTNRGIYAATETTTDTGVTPTSAMLAFGLSQGKAYVKGYEIAKIGTTYVDVNKARDYDTSSGITTRFNIGSYLNVENVYGSPDIGFVSGEVENYKALRLVDEAHGTRGTVFGTSLAYVYDIGRAKSRAFEYSSGTASTVFMSSSSVTDSVYKHYLFDIEMFAHVNVKGAMSGALTTGDTLTGGTSGATGTIESISTAGSGTITGATSANPVVVTCSGGHTFTEGQQIYISGVSGITQLNTNYYTVKDPTATTFKLWTAQAAATTTTAAVDGSGYGSFSGSGGTAVHTVIIVNNMKGEFSDNETITAPTNSRTGTVQFSSLGCKGFEQKEFNQTKGVSMAGSPTYTANTSLGSSLSEHKVLTGNITAANSATAVTGSGTRFTTELKIGDSITWSDNANTTVTRVVESIISDTSLELTAALGGADVTTASPYTRRRAQLQGASDNIGIKKLPYDVIKTLLTTDNASVSDTSFKIRRQFVTTLSSSGTATLTAGTNEIFTAHAEADVTVSVMTTGGGGTGAVGDVVTLASAGDYTLGGTPTGKTLAIDLGSGWNGHKIKILATISASVIGAKTKTVNTAQTKTVDTSALATPTTISIGKADVYSITSVYMAADFSTAATTSDTDVTDRFDLDTGQRDNFYDIARLVRKPGKVAPTGRLLITYNYYSHGAGNFFNVDSYSGTDYKDIPAYTSDVTGESFALRDCLDFRPRVDDASTIDSGAVDRSFDGTGASAIEVMKVNSDVTADMEYYLSKRARVYMTSSGKFKVISGASAVEPTFGDPLDDGMHLYDVYLPAYTFDTSTVEVKAIDNRRYTMRDIGNLHQRIENVEYYTQLSLLEANAQNLQIQDSDGFDRFKNGFIVDNFTGHGIGDVADNNYSVSMDMAAGELRPAHHMDNSNLIESDSSLANSTAMTDAIRTTNGYQKTGDLITLPYTEEAYVTQSYASTTVNLNPYDVISFVGHVSLTPDQDEWMETETLPEMTIDIPGVFDTLTGGAGESVQELNLGTVWNEWNSNWSSVDMAGTEVNTRRRENRGRWPFIRDVSRTTVQTVEVNNATRTGIRTSLVPGGLRTQSLGNRVVQVAFATFMRAKDISFSAVGMKPTTRIYPFFDGVDVSSYVTPTGSTAGAALTTDAAGAATGVFALPSPAVSGNPQWRVGKRAFRLTSHSTNSLNAGLVTTSAETDYTAKGMVQTVQGSVVSTRETQIQRTTATDSTQIIGATGTRIVRDDTGAWFDPVCQSFMIDQEDGIYVTSVDLYFASKSSTMPVTLQIRTMINGYPTSEVVPFAEISVAAGSITTSTDASESTTFTFPSPVFLSNSTEYSICAIANTDDYTIYTAKMGQTTLDGSRLISQQPYLGSMFKSQNSTTWTAEQNEDVKFTIKRAKFTTSTQGTVYLVNDVVPTTTLKQNPISTTSGSTTITVHHRNHGMHSTSNNVTIAGVASGTYNGIAHTNINGTYTAIGNIKLDSYTLTAQNSDTASATGDVGGTAVTATRNIMFDVIQPVAGTMAPATTSISANIRTTTGRTLEQSETDFALSTASKQKPAELNTDYYLTAPAIVASAINETNEMSGSKSFSMNIAIETPSDHISPIIDTARLSATLIQNRLYSPVSGTTPDFVADTTNTGGSGPAQYITRPVVLENESTALDIRLTAHVPSTSSVSVYYRLSNADDARKMGDLDWIGFNSDGSADSAVEPSNDDTTFKEHQFSASGLTTFTAFQLKVVLAGTNSSYPPRVKDLRGIALAI